MATKRLGAAMTTESLTYSEHGDRRDSSLEAGSLARSENEKIDVDASAPATLHSGAISTDCPTLQRAVAMWHRLRPEQAQRATIRVIGGPLYAAAEIRRLHYGPRHGQHDNRLRNYRFPQGWGP